MSIHTNFQLRKSSPSAINISERFHDLIGIKKSISSDELDHGIANFWCGMTPNIFVIEDVMDNQEILNAGIVITSLYHFIILDMTYPINGIIVELRGKKYSELRRNDKNVFQNDINMLILNLDSKNKPEESAFRNMVNNLKNID